MSSKYMDLEKEKSGLFIYKSENGKDKNEISLDQHLNIQQQYGTQHLKMHKIQKVQRAARKWVSSLRDLSYEERLDKLQLSTSGERREVILLCLTNTSEVQRRLIYSRGVHSTYAVIFTRTQEI